MTADIELLQQRLAAFYTRQAAHYDQALRIIQQPQADPVVADGNEPGWLAGLQAALSEVASLETLLAPDKAAWLASGHSAGPGLRSILDGLAVKIRQLSEQVDASVAALNTRRQQLAPELDGFLRERRMLQAYDAYGSNRRKDAP